VSFLTTITPKEAYREATENDENGKFHGSPEQYICQEDARAKVKSSHSFN